MTDLVPPKERNNAVRRLLALLEAHHAGEEAHAQRVAVYAVAIGQRMGLAQQELLALKEASLLHDIAKLSLDKSLLVEQSSSSVEDSDLIRVLPTLLSEAPNPGFLEPCLPIMRHHHERWEGKGHPDGLVGSQIPLGSRILAVAECFDSMANRGGWQKPYTEDEAIVEIKNGAGSHYDPAVVQAFLEIQPLVQPLV